jgi:hypothetical protein
MPPGEYIIEVTVSADNFQPITQKFRVISYQNAKDLDVLIHNV